MDSPKETKGWKIGYVLVFVLAIALLTTRFMLFSWPLLFGLVFFILCRNKLWKATTILIVVCAVPVFGFTHGVRSYFNQTGKIVYPGDLRYRTIHPEYRCEIRYAHDSTGIVFLLFSPFIIPDNFSLGASIRAFGKLPGSYLGPYPDEAEAVQILNERGKSITAASSEFRFNIAGNEYKLDYPRIDAFRRSLVNDPDRYVGAVIDGQCILIGTLNDEDEMDYWINMFNAKTGEQIGFYWQ